LFLYVVFWLCAKVSEKHTASTIISLDDGGCYPDHDLYFLLLAVLTAFRKFVVIFVNVSLSEIRRSTVFFLDLEGRGRN
jgi:hypothetical protein